MIPDAAVEAAHKAWREQAKQDGSIFEYNLRAAIEAAARIIAAEAWEQGAIAGWKQSGEGWNAEYPSRPEGVYAVDLEANPYR